MPPYSSTYLLARARTPAPPKSLDLQSLAGRQISGSTIPILLIIRFDILLTAISDMLIGFIPR